MKPIPADVNVRCSFCGKSPSEVSMIMDGGSSESKVRICNECFLRGLTSIARSGSDLAVWFAAENNEDEPDKTSPAKTYADVDIVINDWISKHALTLHKEWIGEARFWYTSRGKECFQVSIDQPNENIFTVHAWSVDTDDDAELHGEWTVSKEALEPALASATRLIDQWANRGRPSAESRLKSS